MWFGICVRGALPCHWLQMCDNRRKSIFKMHTTFHSTVSRLQCVCVHENDIPFMPILQRFVSQHLFSIDTRFSSFWFFALCFSLCSRENYLLLLFWRYSFVRRFSVVVFLSRCVNEIACIHVLAKSICFIFSYNASIAFNAPHLPHCHQF